MDLAGMRAAPGIERAVPCMAQSDIRSPSYLAIPARIRRRARLLESGQPRSRTSHLPHPLGERSTSDGTHPGEAAGGLAHSDWPTLESECLCASGRAQLAFNTEVGEGLNAVLCDRIDRDDAVLVSISIAIWRSQSSSSLDLCDGGDVTVDVRDHAARVGCDDRD